MTIERRCFLPSNKLHVNRRTYEVPDSARRLLSVLRDDLELTGTKYGCGEGQCGACTVLVDGRAVKSCLLRADTIGNSHITTIEGLAPEGRLHPVQQAFIDAGAFQCGFCTPGMIIAGVALLSRNPDPSQRDIVDALDRNLCRCGTYRRIVRAIQAAAQVMRGGSR